MPIGAGRLQRGSWCQRSGRIKVDRGAPCSSQKLGARAIRRYLLGRLPFLTPDAAERPLRPWLSRAFLPEILLSASRLPDPRLPEAGGSHARTWPDEGEGPGPPRSPASTGWGGSRRRSPRLPERWVWQHVTIWARCDFGAHCRGTQAPLLLQAQLPHGPAGHHHVHAACQGSNRLRGS